MFTVTLGFEGSGNDSTRKPLGYAYSVMPSTEVSFCTPGGRLCDSSGAATSRRVKIGIRALVCMVSPGLWRLYIPAHSGRNAATPCNLPRYTLRTGRFPG